MTIDPGVTCTNTVAYSVGFCVGTCDELDSECLPDAAGTVVVFMGCSDGMYSLINPFSAGTVFIRQNVTSADVRF